MHYSVEGVLSTHRVQDPVADATLNFNIPIIRRHLALHSENLPVKVIGSCFESLYLGRLLVQVGKMSRTQNVTMHLINTFKAPALLFPKRNARLITHIYTIKSPSILSSILLNRSDCLLASSKRIMNRLAERCSTPVVQLYPPIDVNFFKPAPQAENQTDDLNRRILYMGNLTSARLPSEILEGLAPLLRSMNVELQILAPFNSHNLRRRHEILEKVSKLGIRHSVSVDVKDITEQEKLATFRKAYAFIFVPKTEVDVVEPPLAPMEAMACGVPVVSSPVAGLNEIMLDGHNGLICDVKETALQRIPDLLFRIVQDQSLRNRLSINARKTMESIYVRSIREIGALL
jgi:glycosyltransferase involved in cell wall biosynthesis